MQSLCRQAPRRSGSEPYSLSGYGTVTRFAAPAALPGRAVAESRAVRLTKLPRRRGTHLERAHVISAAAIGKAMRRRDIQRMSRMVGRKFFRMCYTTLLATAPLYGIPLHLLLMDEENPIDNGENQALGEMPPREWSPLACAQLSTSERRAWEDIVSRLR